MTNTEIFPLVSVVLPTFRRADKLAKSLESILNQDYKNIEVIIVDDNGPGSSDGRDTFNAISAFIDSPQVYYIAHIRNMGGGGARNTGILSARGAYVTFLDDDDIYTSDKIRLQVECFLNSRIPNLGLVYCRRYSFMESGKLYKKDYSKMVRGNVFDDMLVTNYVSTPTAMVSRKCLLEVGGFDERLTSRQDHDLFLRISRNYQIDYVDYFLVGMLVHRNRISRDIAAKEKGWKIFLEKWDKEISLNSKIKKEVYFNYYWLMSKVYYANADFLAARKFAVSALSVDPYKYKPALLWVMTYFKKALFIK